METMKLFLTYLVIFLILGGCAAVNGGKVSSLFFSVDDDKKLGKQVSDEINKDRANYPILSEAKYTSAYKYLNTMKDRILASGKVAHKADFVWKLKIIDKDVLNAFATPGGYIYVYTGLIKYLDNADDLAGVLGHEIAHADRRHSIKQMEKVYGVQLLLDVALGSGSSSQVKEIAKQLAGAGTALKFSRDHEADADEYSVIYLGSTSYACNGAASFFEKLSKNNKGGRVPEFMSTHPSPDNRIEDINAKAKSLGCSTRNMRESGMTYAQFKKSIP